VAVVFPLVLPLFPELPVPSAGLGLPMPLMLAETLRLLALKRSRLAKVVALSVPVVSWLRSDAAAAAVLRPSDDAASLAMTPPVSVVLPATRISNPPLPALMPLCS
jgi:hypothetical protein